MSATSPPFDPIPDLLRLRHDRGKDTDGAKMRAAVRRWTCRALWLDERDTVIVTEHACSGPGCPPREVVVTVLSARGQRRQRWLHCRLEEVDENRVIEAWSRPD